MNEAYMQEQLKEKVEARIAAHYDQPPDLSDVKWRGVAFLKLSFYPRVLQIMEVELDGEVATLYAFWWDSSDEKALPILDLLLHDFDSGLTDITKFGEEVKR